MISSAEDGGFAESDSCFVPMRLKLQSVDVAVLVLQLDVRFSYRKSITLIFIVSHLLVPLVQFITVMVTLSFRVFCYFILVSPVCLKTTFVVFILMLYLFFPQSQQGRCCRETTRGHTGALHCKCFSKPGNEVLLQLLMCFTRACANSLPTQGLHLSQGHTPLCLLLPLYLGSHLTLTEPLEPQLLIQEVPCSCAFN